MQINVGFTSAARQVSLTTDLTVDEITSLLTTHAGPDADPLVLTDTSGRTLVVAPGQLAYIEVLPERSQQVGFGVG